MSLKNFSFKLKPNLGFTTIELKNNMQAIVNYLNENLGISRDQHCWIESFERKDWPYQYNGHYLPWKNKIEILYAKKSQFFNSLIHEVSHHHLHSIIYEPPRWLDEGIAQYAFLENSKIIKGEIKEDKVKLVLNCINNNSEIPLEDLIYSDFESLERKLAYAESWSLVHFLIHTSRFKSYFKRFKFRGENFFNVKELKQIEPKWKCYLDLLTTNQDISL